jgi:hypothetical protein
METTISRLLCADNLAVAWETTISRLLLADNLAVASVASCGVQKKI